MDRWTVRLMEDRGWITIGWRADNGCVEVDNWSVEGEVGEL